MDLFHQRLTVELQEKLSDATLIEMRPEWPMAPSWEAFEDMMLDAFDVGTLDHIPGRIRDLSRGVSGRQVLVHVRHAPVQSSRVINPGVLKTYLEWWDQCFAELLERQVFALLGVSFVMGKPEVFHRVLTERERVSDMPLDRTVLWVLDEMERVTKQDLIQFLQTHNVAIPLSHRDRVLDDILARTRGDYDVTLEALKDLAARAWAAASDDDGDSEAEVYDDDYN